MIDFATYRMLAEKNGTPLYIFHEEEFLNNYDELVGCFRKAYPNYQISYSYKTNYTPYICRIIKNKGGYAEVVSDMEYTLAKRLGYTNDKIVYNGPAKGPMLEEHLLNGGINNIDNLSEALRICRLADENSGKIIKTGLRINVNLGRGSVSRFGLDPDSGDMERVLSELKKRENIRINGVHCHLSHARDLEAWSMRTELMLKSADRFVGGIPEYISLGSGMFGRMDDALAAQFGCNVPCYEDYAGVTMDKIAAHYLGGSEKPIVFSEPGATLISKYISFLTKVKDIKTVAGRTVAVTDGSFYNLGEISLKKQLPLTVIRNGDDNYHGEYDIVGYTCLEYDTMYRAYNGTLNGGDLLIFGNVGGYSIVSKPQFIRPNCPMVVIDKNGIIKEIMRGETFEDIFSKFFF